MDRNREARRASIVGSNGFNRRRHRTSSLRARDGDMGSNEVYESMRLRERVRKDRVFRERADRVMKASKGRRKGRSISHTVNDETSEEESMDEDEDEDDDTFSFNQTHRNHSISNHHLQQRRSFPLSSTNCNYTKSCRGVIGVFVPRKARSGRRMKASRKRSHYWISSTGNNSSGLALGDGELIHRQAEGSPATHAVIPASNQAPILS